MLARRVDYYAHDAATRDIRYTEEEHAAAEYAAGAMLCYAR